MFRWIQNIEILVMDEMEKGLFEDEVIVITRVGQTSFIISFEGTDKRLDTGNDGESCQEAQDKFFRGEPGWEMQCIEGHLPVLMA